MKYIVSKLLLLVLCLCLINVSVDALPYKGKVTKKAVTKADNGLTTCRRAQGSAELSLNNVRARINQGGNMWYDGSSAHYYVPKDGTSTAMFCAALWIGGQDENKQLRVAALKFGSSGDDFWPGPLTADGTASVDKAVCDEWDKIYRITKAEVQAFISSFELDVEGKPIPGTYDPETLTDVIAKWPGNGNTSLKQSKFLAPFYDQNKDGRYDYNDGDYPYYDFEGKLCPAKIKAELPAGSKYTPTPTMESDTTNSNYGTGPGMKPVTGGLLVDQVLKGDETLWWIFNDKGAAHTESGSENPIGLEIRAQAFAFTMNNEINNMTFYSYEIINRSTFVLTNTYFSQWVDADLGYAFDDYVGCDVERGLGYAYNGQKTDGPGQGAYAGNPPAIGIDFFQGPYMDPDGKDNPKVDLEAFIENYGSKELGQYCVQAGLTLEDTTNIVTMKNSESLKIILTDNAYKYKRAWYPKSKDSVDACAINGVNFGNGIVDDERFGMRRFIYYNNSSASNGEPEKASDYYNYLRGIWKDNTRMQFGGDGYSSSSTGFEPGIYSDFMFPATSDIWGWGVRQTGREEEYARKNWSEITASNSPGDRRFMQSAGPFTLQPGAINYITVGIPFAQAVTGGPEASVELLRLVDDKCQSLFDNCFNVLEGPDAPDVVVQELDREIILYLTNETGNNVNESFRAMDESIPRDWTETIISGTDTNIVTHEYDRYYRFEGYQIFQLADASVSVADIYDNSKARLVAQCDIENYDPAQNNAAIAELVNVTITNGNPSSQIMVSGENLGVKHSFRITEDKFATTTDKRIVNNKKYYYIAIAYAYNCYKPYSVEDATKLDGQKEPYLASRKKGDGSSIEPVMAIPHKIESEQNGTLVQSSYGVSPELVRIEGNGNGGMILNIKSESVNELFEKNTNMIENPVYETNYGPVNIRVVDPLNVKAGDYCLKLIPNPAYPTVLDSCGWELTCTDSTKPLFKDGNDDIYKVESDRPIGEINEQIIFGLGISVFINNGQSLAHEIDLSVATLPNVNNAVNPGAYLYSSIEYAEADKAWLYGFADNDASSETNWIRSGSSIPAGTDGTILTDPNADYYYVPSLSQKAALDPTSQFENVVYGIWAPYKLTSIATAHPAYSRSYIMNATDVLSNNYIDPTMMASIVYNDLNNLASVDIVFTNDKSKWTRCPVIEMGTDTTMTEGGAKKFMLRRHASVDKDGNPDMTNTTGMGWFPGYAVNLETGERLNIIFGENSSLGQFNGRDMMWNPSYYGSGLGSTYGGMHYVYILGTSEFGMRQRLNTNAVIQPRRYDEGKWAYDILAKLSALTRATGNDAVFDEVESLFASVMWVGMPAPTTQLFAQGVEEDIDKKSPTLIPTDATIKIRVKQPYKMYLTGNTYDGREPSVVQNDNYPMYRFTIDDEIATLRNVTSIAESALDNIMVVPNPYYAFNLYEKDQIDNVVKITNLPPDCYITIYSVDGTVVRKLRGPSINLVSGGGTALTSVDWDLKNERGLQISGGVYLIHVKADGIGEKLVKWFGALRPVDLNSFQ